jgi:membrane fusion protein, multidrug efflux system
MRTKIRTRVIILIAGTSCLLIAFFLGKLQFFRNKAIKKPVQISKTVTVIKVKPENNIEKLSYPAYVQANCEAVLFFRVSGPIVEVNVKPGDKVTKGTVMFKVDSRDYERQVSQLKHQLAAQKARLDESLLEFQRNKGLYDKRAVSKMQFDKKLSNYLVEKANTDSLKNEIRVAKDQLTDTELKAPFDGIITKQHLEKYEMARVGEPVLAMHDISLVEIVAFIPEDDIVNLIKNKNSEFQVRLPSIKRKIFKAVLYEWSTIANQETRTYGVVFRIKQPPETSVLPGMTAELVWEKYKPGKSTTFNIPFAAFVSTSLKNGKIWTVDPQTNTVFSKTVTLGKYNKGECLQVAAGLKANSLVVVEGAHFLRRGTKVNIITRSNKTIK